MATSINTNISSINAQRNLNRSQGALQTSFQRLSSGLRINGAKDDAAGLAISNRFTTQVRGLNVAIRNGNDGISFAQTAEGALTEVTTALQRIRDLAVQSANDTNSTSDREALQAEVSQLVSEIDRIASTTEFNGTNVLDGSKDTLNFHIGANANQTISVAGVDAKASSLGTQPGVVQSQGQRVSIMQDGADAGTDGLTENGIEAGDADLSGFSIQIDGMAAAIDITADKYGGNITADSVANLTNRLSATYGGGQAKSIAARINTVREAGDFEGVYASATTTFRGSDVTAADYAGANVAADNTIAAGSLTNGDLQINGIDIGPVEFLSNDSDGKLRDAINAKTSDTGVVATVDSQGELILTADDGRDIIIDTTTDVVTNNLFGGGGTGTDGFNAGANVGFTSLRATGVLTVSGNDTITFTGETDEVSVEAADLTAGQDNAQATGTVKNIDISTVAGSNTAIEAVDSALAQVDQFRADLGAVQNRFESTIRNLSSVSESLSAANSRILDADFAAETAALSKNQVLQQAGISVLAQANAAPQQALSLLG